MGHVFRYHECVFEQKQGSVAIYINIMKFDMLAIKATVKTITYVKHHTSAFTHALCLVYLHENVSVKSHEDLPMFHTVFNCITYVSYCFQLYQNFACTL